VMAGRRLSPATASLSEPHTESPTTVRCHDLLSCRKTASGRLQHPSRLLKKGRLPLTLNCESDSYANKGMAGGIDARFGCADG
jgi:hypothetical protein